MLTSSSTRSLLALNGVKMFAEFMDPLHQPILALIVNQNQTGHISKSNMIIIALNLLF